MSGMIPNEVLEILRLVWTAFQEIWWLILPPFLLLVFLEQWKGYIKISYLKSLKWSHLEIRVPKNIERTPKAMEQIFAALYGSYLPLKFMDKWRKGRVLDWASFEMVGNETGVSFYVRVPESNRNLIEAAIYAQYPEAEIHEAVDYVEAMPSILPNKTYDLFGMDFVLAREDAYPIRTYEYFEDKEEERRLDSVAAIVEVMSKLKAGETIWLQLLVQPTNDDWKKKSEEEVNKLIGLKSKKSKGFFPDIVEGGNAFLRDLIKAPFVPLGKEEVVEKKSDSGSQFGSFTQTKKDVVKAIEEKAAKLSFKTNLRFIYIDRRDAFTRVNVSAVVGAIQQFNTKHLNAFKPNGDTITVGKWPFKARGEYLKKRSIMFSYRYRAFAKKTFILNIEELATVFHLPTLVVGAPRLQKLESKKGGPPPNLPIE